MPRGTFAWTQSSRSTSRRTVVTFLGGPLGRPIGALGSDLARGMVPFIIVQAPPAPRGGAADERPSVAQPGRPRSPAQGRRSPRTARGHLAPGVHLGPDGRAGRG